MHSRRLIVLIVEDSSADARLTTEALRDAEIRSVVHVVKNGDEALQFLRAAATPESLPDLIILDLNLPGTDGREVLREVKAEPELRSIPVVVFSTSNDANDIDEAYRQGASCYVVKPIDADLYFLTIRQLKELWFKVAALPPHGSAKPELNTA